MYTDAELAQLADTIDADPAYVMFNNLPRAADAWRFSQLVRPDAAAARSTPVDAGPSDRRPAP